jgi:ATP-binding cassette subfamily B protein
VTDARQGDPRHPTWWYVWQLIRFRLGTWLLLGVLETLFFGVFPQITGLVTRTIFNTLTGEVSGIGASVGVWWLIAAIVGIALARAVVIFGDVFVYFNFRYTLAALLRKNLFRDILARPGARAVPGSPGEAISRFRGDVDEIAFFLAESMILTGFGLFTVVAIVVMVRIDARITVLALLPMLLVIGVTRWATARIDAYREASREATGAVTGFIGEIYGAIQAVKVATAESRLVRRFTDLSEVRRRAAIKDRVFNTTLDTIHQNIANLATGVILLLIAGTVRATGISPMSVGDIALFVFYLGIITQFTGLVGQKLAWYKQIGVSIRRLVALLQETPPEQLVDHGPVYMRGELPEVPVPVQGPGDRLRRLEVTGLSYHYPGTDQGVEGVDLSLEPGAFTVITGRVGSGKTTLLRALLGLLEADAGEIRWNGERIDRPAEFFTPPRSAYTPQVPALFSESLRDNIMLGLPGDRFDLQRALWLAVMEPDLVEMPDGLETMLGTEGVRLSGGQRQRTAAARMFVREPALLVFDDLSSALDVETERLLWQRVDHLRERGAACLVVSHRRPALRRADRILLLEEGSVLASGSLSDLLTLDEMQQLWHGEMR